MKRQGRQGRFSSGRFGPIFSSGRRPLEKGGIVEVDCSSVDGVAESATWYGVVNYIERGHVRADDLVHVEVFAQHGM